MRTDTVHAGPDQAAPVDPDSRERRTVVVVGGGLAGLAAAANAARAGVAVTLLDARRDLGGRARTRRVGGPGGEALFNEGPHALYRDRGGAAVLAELGIEPSGGAPASPVWLEDGGKLHVLPARARDVLRPSMTTAATTARIGALLLGRRGPRPEPSTSMEDWIVAATTDRDARRVLALLTRVACYCPDPAGIAAAAAVPQIRSAARPGVTYVDGGWTVLVEGLRRAAETAGVVIRRGVRVQSVGVHQSGGGPVAIDTSTGERIDAAEVVLAAGGAGTAAALLAKGGRPSAALEAAADAARPVRATTLDLHLSRLPRPEVRVCFPLDEPLYLSVHTPSARLATNGEVVHLMRYGSTADFQRARRDLEAFADRVQPGWRDLVLAESFGSSRVVAHDRPQPGPAAWDTVQVPDVSGVTVAGDWVVAGNRMLADAALVSGRDAGRAAAARLRGVRA